jgi:hypothetical protein
MAVSLYHKVISNTALPYITYDTPVSTDPMINSGLNVMTSARGFMQQYPGFATALASNTFGGLERFHIWKKWTATGSYIAMYSDLVGGVATVWKQELGVDAAAVLIWTSTSAEPFDFTDNNNFCYFGNGTDMKKYDGTTVYKWGLATPTAAPSVGTSGTGISAYAGGWYYLTTAYRSIDAHESSPLEVSACTGSVSNKQIDITWLSADYDSEADYVRIYRTTDGGSTNPIQMALVAQVLKSALTYADTKTDAQLSATTFAPPLYRNDPPPAAKGFAKYAGRIYMFANDTVYFTGREEISNGVPFDCVPGGLDGNYARFDGEITGVAPRASGIAVFLARKIWALDGATLDTMYPYLLLDRRGAHTRTNIISLGNTVIWFDSAKQVWMDGEEIGKDIRPDLEALDPNNVSIAVHLSGQYHWLLVCDSASGQLWTYDLDTQQWMPPRSCGAEYVYSMNTTDSSIDLLIARNGTRVLKMTPATFTDDGTSYNSNIVTTLFDMAPAANPDFNGWCRSLGIESNATQPSAGYVLVDDDPDFATFSTALTQNTETNFLRKTGTYIRESQWMAPIDDTNPSGKRCAFRIEWNSLTDWKLYGLDVAIQPAQTVPA